MNERYLFRGQRVDTKEWVYGYLLPKFDGVYIDLCESFENDGGTSLNVFKVIPETVGQWTTLKDKNGKLVFEGDIIKITRGEKPKMFNIPQIQITDVYYDKGAFRYRWGDGSGSVLDFNSVKIVKGYESVTQDVEVIGNIHQNSELLEKGGK